MRSPRLRLLGAATASIILLAACGSDTGDGSDVTDGPDDAAVTSMAPHGDLEDVDIEFGAEGDGADLPSFTWGGVPFAEGELPFSVETTEIRELEAGDGEELTPEHHAVARYAVLNGTTGEELVSTFPTDQTVVFNLADQTLLPGILQMLDSASPGSRLLAAISPEDGFGAQGAQQLGVSPVDTLLFYIEVVDAHIPLTQAEGTPVDPVEGLPTVEADGTTPAVVTIPEDEEPPTELVVQLLVEGEGPETQAGQAVTVHYTGVSWDTGQMFDNSLERGAPFTVNPLGQASVIDGWNEGLQGLPVGSRVMLILPPDLAYGDEGSELSGQTLVFIVDILDAD